MLCADKSDKNLINQVFFECADQFSKTNQKDSQKEQTTTTKQMKVSKTFKIDDTSINYGDFMQKYNLLGCCAFYKKRKSPFPSVDITKNSHIIYGPAEITVYDNQTIFIKEF